MAHFASYWQFYDDLDEPLVVTSWRIGLGNRVADAAKGDVLWLFTSGKKCRRKLDKDELPIKGVEDGLAYLSEVFVIQSIVSEVAGRFKLLVKGTEKKCVGIFPPLFIDDIVRPEGWSQNMPIGNLRQGAWRLPAEVAAMLQKELKSHAPGAYRKVFGY
ncbi:MAG: hypothetical protein HY243_01040 [Proteobacteria bacterium]|nr:hypothetical protein [Pseudomonadota bacterium]